MTILPVYGFAARFRALQFVDDDINVLFAARLAAVGRAFRFAAWLTAVRRADRLTTRAATVGRAGIFRLATRSLAVRWTSRSREIRSCTIVLWFLTSIRFLAAAFFDLLFVRIAARLGTLRRACIINVRNICTTIIGMSFSATAIVAANTTIMLLFWHTLFARMLRRALINGVRLARLRFGAFARNALAVRADILNRFVARLTLWLTRFTRIISVRHIYIYGFVELFSTEDKNNQFIRPELFNNSARSATVLQLV